MLSMVVNICPSAGRSERNLSSADGWAFILQRGASSIDRRGGRHEDHEGYTRRDNRLTGVEFEWPLRRSGFEGGQATKADDEYIQGSSAGSMPPCLIRRNNHNHIYHIAQAILSEMHGSEAQISAGCLMFAICEIAVTSLQLRHFDTLHAVGHMTLPTRPCYREYSFTLSFLIFHSYKSSS